MNNKSVQKEKVSNQQTLFALAPDMMMQQISLREALPATTKEILLWEKELLGLYVSAHPYQKVAERVSDLLTPLTHLESCKDGLFVKCGGLVTSVKKILTKKGDPMAFVGIDDIKGVGEIVVFPKVFDSHKEKLEEDVLVLVSAKVSKRPGEETKLLANDFIFIEEGEEQELKEMLQNGMWVAVPSKVSHAEVQKSQSLRNTSRIIITLKGKPSQELITELRELFTASPGLIKVCLAIESVGGVRNVETDYHVHIDNQFILALEGIIEKENILQE